MATQKSKCNMRTDMPHLAKVGGRWRMVNKFGTYHMGKVIKALDWCSERNMVIDSCSSSD